MVGLKEVGAGMTLPCTSHPESAPCSVLHSINSEEKGSASCKGLSIRALKNRSPWSIGSRPDLSAYVGQQLQCGCDVLSCKIQRRSSVHCKLYMSLLSHRSRLFLQLLPSTECCFPIFCASWVDLKDEGWEPAGVVHPACVG